MKISLVIPVRNEARSLDALWGSISVQSRMPDEVIFVDAGSTDETADIIKKHSRMDTRIRLVAAGPAYPGSARNAGVGASNHGAIAFTDGGIRLDRDWLKRLSETMENGSNPDVVYGTYEPVTDSFFKECLAIAFVPAPRTTPRGKMRPYFIASSMIKKDVFDAAGGFPAFRAAEDRIFMGEIDKRGFRVDFAPEAKVFWDIPGSFGSVFRRFSLYSMHDLRAGRYRDWHRAVIRMYLLGVLVILLGIFHSPAWLMVLLAAILARAGRAIIKKAEGDSLMKRFSFKKLLPVAVLMLWIDFAMFCGVAEYLWCRISGR